MSKFRSFTKEMKKRLSTDVKGFTLIEVIVVLVILAILMAIAIPNVLGYINKAKGTENELTARNIYMAANVESAEILKSSTSITPTNLTDHIPAIKSLAGLKDADVVTVTSTTVGTNETAPAADANNAKVVLYLTNGLINGLTYVPAGGDDGTKFVNYYANGTFTKGTDYVAIDTVVPEVSTSAA